MYEMTHSDLDAVNSFERPCEVEVVRRKETWGGSREFQEHSFTLLVFDFV